MFHCGLNPTRIPCWLRSHSVCHASEFTKLKSFCKPRTTANSYVTPYLSVILLYGNISCFKILKCGLFPPFRYLRTWLGAIRPQAISYSVHVVSKMTTLFCLHSTFIIPVFRVCFTICCICICSRQNKTSKNSRIVNCSLHCTTPSTARHNFVKRRRQNPKLSVVIRWLSLYGRQVLMH